ncbi:MAG TPA: UDP-3-O-(3-hydroxymyristoyl)glucosamine N-acyltransferase [Bacteroidota bacterium]|nr:UDP-3-O-(3-hydroxymyristoyl)glucosamine N-acyltransferase [Bacteroidota bacterium]
MTVQEIAAWLHGDVIGNGAVPIERVAKIEEADKQSLSFLANPKYERYLETTRAGAVLVSKQYDKTKLPRRPDIVFIAVDDPYVAFVEAHKRLTPSLDPFTSGIHPTAVIAKTAQLGEGVSVGAHAVVGDGVIIGNNTKISHGCVIGTEARLGASCLLYPNVTVYHQCRIGDRVTLHAGTVIGADGFGFAPKEDGPFEKIPQLGIVVIKDDVEIGANATIDRATLGETVIERGVKIDNLVQVAHNCVIGENTVIAAQSGVSGSVRIGRNCMIGGQVGIAGHLEIADHVTILAQSGISKSIEEPGTLWFGFPAKERKRAQRIEAVIRSLPEMSQDLYKLQQEFEKLRKNTTEEKS